MRHSNVSQIDLVPCEESKLLCKRQEYRDNKTASPLSTGHTRTSVLDQELSSPTVESSTCSISTISSAPICRQFWKSGNYDESLSSKSSIPKGTNYLHIHPKFLHSNATSHKWAFGAIAELIDNSVDEVYNGATFVMIDKTLNPKDGSTALLVQDDGGGMDPGAMRHCLSFGFSDKKSKTAIDGNGFKTSSMRLGSDVIVFSRHLKNRKLTQSIGLLSYTFLMQTGHDRIVVPMVDYEFHDKTNTWNALNSGQHNLTNLSLLLQWSPYSSEDNLLKQFDDIGNHGTKIIVFNLWHNNDGKLELDFESDSEDIRISGEENGSEKESSSRKTLSEHHQENGSEKGGSRKTLTEEHLANRLRFSLRAYLSVLYLRVPENFSILLRGRQVEYYNIASNLKFRECILYSPQRGAGFKEGEVITAIGFSKEAPQVNIHGFNVYHKNRLILPFWHVASCSSSRGRGVIGVLEANFIEPTHNKQDFEKTSVFQKLEHRLREMIFEYWDYHCGLIGYKALRKPRMMTSQVTPDSTRDHGLYQPVHLNTGPSSRSSSPAIQHQTSGSPHFVPKIPTSVSIGPLKRKECDDLLQSEKLKRKIGLTGNAMASNSEILYARDAAIGLDNQEAAGIIDENKRLKARCLERERGIEELQLKVARLRVELSVAQSTYSNMFAESKMLQRVKEEKGV